MTIQLGAVHWLTITELQNISSGGAEIFITEPAWERIDESRRIMERYTLDRIPIYGVNTQFGDDAYRVVIEGDYDQYVESVVSRQNSVMRALGCALGEELGPEIARASLALRIHTLAQGCSGVRRSLVERLLRLLQADILPRFFKFGSVGASGDLIPLSAIARLVMGEGDVRVGRELRAASDALAGIGFTPEALTMKEGLAIVNGTSFMTAVAALSVARLCWLLPMSLAAGAACVEAMSGMDSPYTAFVHKSKNHQGQVAEFIRACWKGSSLIRSLDTLRQEWRSMILREGRAEQENIQDYYSLRGIAHGFGPFCDDVARAVLWIENEMKSLNDNPLVEIDAAYVHSSANFLGDYVAVICDHLRADVGKAGTWLHALFGNIVNPRKSRGLPSCLVCRSRCCYGI
jgi:histidine ammonia-lyase